MKIRSKLTWGFTIMALISVAVFSAIEFLLMRGALENKDFSRFDIIVPLVLGGVLGAGMIIMAISAFFARSFTRPIIRLKDAVIEAGKGNFPVDVNVSSKDEIGDLADAFKKMINDLQETTVSKDFFNSIVEFTADALIVFDPQWKIQLANRAACLLLGYEEEDLIGKDFGFLFDQEGKGRSFIKGSSKILSRGDVVLEEVMYKARWGERIPVNISVSGIKDEKGQLARIVSVAEDMREINFLFKKVKESTQKTKAAAGIEKKKADDLREAYQALEKMETAALNIMEDFSLARKDLEVKNEELKRLGALKFEFLSTVSHELRTPLTIMREFTSIISDELPGKLTKDQKEYMNIIESNINRLARLISNLLDISKIESGKILFRKTPVNIVKIAKDVIKAFKFELSEKNIKLKTFFPPSAANIYADADRMTQVFTNLMENAIKFTPKNEKIVVEIKRGEKEIECSVTDTGVGIAPDNREKIFDRFQQFGRAAGPGDKGIGLGLAITKKIIERHDGRIWIESKVGKGSKFIFSCPYARTTHMLIRQ